MTHRTAVLFNSGPTSGLDHRIAGNLFYPVEGEEREHLLASYPHAVVLELSFAELDYANRWCWQQFGPAQGACLQAQSEYQACDRSPPHSHEGKWVTDWLEKTDYNFGYNAWCFAEQEDRDRFLQFFPEINWGEKYSK